MNVESDEKKQLRLQICAFAANTLQAGYGLAVYPGNGIKKIKTYKVLPVDRLPL